MKKAILRVLLVICGLNVFTSCYGMPPEDWSEQTPLPEDQEETKSPAQTAEEPILEDVDASDSATED